MNKALLLLIVLQIWYNLCQAQFPDNTWILGYSSTGAPIQDSFGLSTLTFDDNILNIGPERNFDYRFDTNNTSMSDEEGSLIFYSNANDIRRPDHALIQNGDNMYTGDLDRGHQIPQGTLVLPIPERENEFLILSTHLAYYDELSDVAGEALYYSILDMNENDGEGRITVKNEILEEGQILHVGQLTACRHANGRDWWIVWPYWNSNRFMRFQVNPSGIVRYDDQIIGDTISSGLGQSIFTPDGNRFITYNNDHIGENPIASVYDFDRCEGLLSNPTQIIAPIAGYSNGAAVSSNSRFLYLINQGYIFQYDLDAEDIVSTQDTVAAFDGLLDPWLPASFFMGQLARDGRIYISSPNGVMSLTVIEYPDRAGEACEVNQHAVRLPVHVSYGIPTFPNHRLGPLDGSPCDTLGIDNVPLAAFRTDQDSSDYLGFYFQDLSAYEPADWAWDFGDGGVSQDTSPVHTYAQDGTYEVCLTVSNAYGSDTYCQTLQVGTTATDGPVAEVNIQAFPNPFQDQFSVVFTDYYPRHARLRCYDAAGRRVHEQRLYHGWNGVDGSGWPAGVYFYEVWEGERRIEQGKVIKN